MQQGRTQLDADWNEQNSIDLHYERAALQDVIGSSGTPIDSVTGYSDGFQIRLRSSISVTPSMATAQTLVTLKGTNFALNSDVSLSLDETLLTKVQTDQTGAISGAQFNVPAGLAAGTHALSATDSDGNSGIVSFIVASGPGLYLDPSFGTPGSSVTLGGYGFTAGDSVTLALTGATGATAAAATVAPDGSFASKISFPSSTPPGSCTVTASDQHGISASLSFVVLATAPSITISPSSGLPLVQVSVTGSGFPANSSLTLRWDDPLSPAAGQAPTDQTGAISGAQFNVPSSATGGLHTILVADQNGYAVYATATFTLAGYIIKHGHYYVDGILCENEDDLEADQQPDLPLLGGTSPAIPSGTGTSIVYLDVWERHLTYLDDPEIREVALLGPDTATRTKIVWQVKLLQVTGGRAVAPGGGSVVGNFNRGPLDSITANDVRLDVVATDTAIMEKFDCNTDFPAWQRLVSPSSGKLSARAKPTAPSADPCDLPAQAGYTSLQNQLYRVEIHDGGVLGIISGGKRGILYKAPTFKWSRDNGIVVSKVSDIDAADPTQTVLTVSSTGKKPNLSFETGMWVEITSDVNDLWGTPGTIAKVVDVDPAQNTIKINPDPTVVVGPSVTDANYPQQQNPKVRRWDWVQGNADTPPYKVQIPLDNDGYIELEEGVEVKFSEGTYRTGDYWLVPARTATADVDWPETVAAVDWASIPLGGSDATALATFLAQRFGLDGIQASEFTPNGQSEIDATYQDPSNQSHTLSISLNEENTLATLTVDGIVGAQIPVITESDGSLTLQCGTPDARSPEGIKHHYARLALLKYDLATQFGSVSAGSPAAGSPSAGTSGSSIALSIFPQSATITPGQQVGALVTISAPGTNKQAVFVSSLTSSAPGGLAAVISYANLQGLQPGDTRTVPLSVTADPGIAPGTYAVTISFAGNDDSGNSITASATMTVTVAVPLEVLADCRQLFPPLTDLPSLFYVSGDGQTANPDYSLPSPLVAATSVRTVRFTIERGSGSLGNPASASGPGAHLDVATGPDQLVSCVWQLDNVTQAQRVRAEALDSDGNPINSPPIYYNAVLPVLFFYVSGDGQTSSPQSTVALAAGVSVGVTIPQPASNYAVQFAVKSGSGSLTDSTGAPLTAPVPIDPASGIAGCNWVLGSSGAQQVEALLFVNSAQSDLQPVYFNAQLASPAMSATTGLIKVAGVPPGTAKQLGPFKHFLKVAVPPAILLGFEDRKSGADNMADGGYLALQENSVASRELKLPQEPVVSAVNVGKTQFYVDILVPQGQKSQTYYLRWWAVPASPQADQQSTGQ